MTTKITEQNISNLANAGIQWQAVITADGSTATTAVAGRGYLIDTTSNAHTINLPSSAITGDTIAIKDYAGTFGTNALTIARNGSNIQGVASNSQISTNRASVELIYVDSTKGWVYTNESNVADLGEPLFTIATGGTITTSGDYKIHTFTGDGCFVVSQLGNAPTNPLGGPQTVSYLVVAGGGSGGGGTPSPSGFEYEGGGGGAGGFREGRDIAPSYTASPLVAPTGLTITQTTYPVTVGAGGSGISDNDSQGNDGSNSVFSTITSTGGGGGGSRNTAAQPGRNGGSGGGSGQGDTCSPGGYSVVSNVAQNFGTGNTPPVSPSQGNPGGGGTVGGSPASSGGGGGGGAGSSGTPGSYPSAVGGNGGSGVSSSITGSSVTRAGGGGGAGTNTSGGLPTSGPGGQGAAPGRAASNGGTNTGGGGGAGASARPESSGAGGKGIVIIRYKYQ